MHKNHMSRGASTGNNSYNMISRQNNTDAPPTSRINLKSIGRNNHIAKSNGAKPVNQSSASNNNGNNKNEAYEEIYNWFNNNPEQNMKLNSINVNKLSISLIHNNEIHDVDIHFPLKYPEEKKGYTIQEVPTKDVEPFKFIKTMNKKFPGKILSIKYVLDYLKRNFKNHVNPIDQTDSTDSTNQNDLSDQENNLVNPIIVLNPSVNENDTWFDLDAKVNDSTKNVSQEIKQDTIQEIIPQTISKIEKNSVVVQENPFTQTVSSMNCDNEEVEMVNLEPDFDQTDETNAIGESSDKTVIDNIIDTIKYHEQIQTDNQIKNTSVKTIMSNSDIMSDMEIIDKILKNEINPMMNLGSEPVKTTSVIPSTSDFDSEPIKTTSVIPSTSDFDSDIVNSIISTSDNTLTEFSNVDKIIVLSDNEVKIIVNEQNKSEESDDVDDRPEEDETFELEKDIVVTRRTTKNAPMISNTSNKSDNIITQQNYDEFVSKQVKILEVKNPGMDEDEMMNIIQAKWEKELKSSKKNADTTTKSNKHVISTEVSFDDDMDVIEEINKSAKSKELTKPKESVKPKKTIPVEDLADSFDDVISDEDLKKKSVPSIPHGEFINDKPVKISKEPDFDGKPIKKSIKKESDSESEEDSDSSVSLVEKSTKKSSKEILTDDIEMISEEEPKPSKFAMKVEDTVFMSEAEDLSYVNEDEDEDEPVQVKASSVPKIPYSKFTGIVMRDLRNKNPGKKQNEYMKMAAAKWADYKVGKYQLPGTAPMKKIVNSNEIDENESSPKNTSVKKSMKLPKEELKSDSKSSNKEIGFSDVNDIHGLYIDLSKFIKVSKLPFDLEKLSAKAMELQNEMDFGSSSKIKKMFSASGAIRVIINEFKRIYFHGLKNNYSVMPVNDNVYHLKLQFNKDFFNRESKIYQDILKMNKKIEIEIQVDSKLYPFYPPKVRLISPRLKNHLNSRIATMECLLPSKWNPVFSVETIVQYFKDLMDQYGEIDSESINYDELENDLIDLSLLSEIPGRVNSFLTLDELKNIKENTANLNNNNGKNKLRYTSGIGYGHEGLAEWNVKSTMKAKEERDKQLSKSIKNITRRLTKIITGNIKIDAVNILINSCYIPYMKSIFYGNNMLELLKNQKQFELLLDSMRILTPEFVPIYLIKDGENDKSLYEIFCDIKSECTTYLSTMKNNTTDTNSQPKNSDITMELALVSNFVSFITKLQKQVVQFDKENKKRNKNKNASSQTLSPNEQYKKELAEELFKPNEDMNLNHFDNLVKNAGETSNTTFDKPKSIQYIAKEMVSLSKALPLERGSSIFYRYNPNNMKFHEFVIAGSEGTPYDSGCFLFRIYCTSKYPDTNPLVNIYTTGNGSVRFNPNLYAEGKVCLSILGTWSAQEGEKWIPGVSTMLQIMVSIQSLVMNEKPYFNEPGYEREFGTAKGEEQSKNYNYNVRLNCMKWAMTDQIQNPAKGFEEAIHTHFRLKADYIKETCKQWVAEAPNNMATQYKTAYLALCKELNGLTGSKEIDTVSDEKPKAKKVLKPKTAIKTKTSKKIVDV
jgi:ubiquitin-protein ligase